LLKLLTTLAEYTNSNSSKDKNDDFVDEAKVYSDDDGPRIEVNIIVPEVSNPADELRSNFMMRLKQQFKLLTPLLVNKIQVHPR
jgi:hypothetical protein